MLDEIFPRLKIYRRLCDPLSKKASRMADQTPNASSYVYATLSRVKNTNLFYFTFETDPQKVNENFEDSNSGLGRLAFLLTRLAKDGWEPMFNSDIGDFTGNLQESLLLRRLKDRPQ